MTLTEVIQDARHTYGLGQNPDTWMWEVTDRYGPTRSFKLPIDAENYLNERITAAVVDWMQSDEAIERMARAMFPEHPVTEEDVAVARAAVAALSGETRGG